MPLLRSLVWFRLLATTISRLRCFQNPKQIPVLRSGRDNWKLASHNVAAWIVTERSADGSSASFSTVVATRGQAVRARASESLSENTHWRETRFRRSAPVLGRSNVALQRALEKPRAIARWTVLWPRTAIFRTQNFQTGSEKAGRQRGGSLRLSGEERSRIEL